MQNNRTPLDIAEQPKGSERIYQAVRDHLAKHKVAIEAKVHEAVFDYLDASGFSPERIVRELLGARIAQVPTGSRDNPTPAPPAKPPLSIERHKEVPNAFKGWTKKDDETLRVLFPQWRNDYIAEMLGRTESALTSRATDIGVKKAPGFTRRKSQLIPQGWKERT